MLCLKLNKCKPEFVVEFMNTLSRTLDLPEIIFIVAANKLQLANALKKVYGQEFDTENYFAKNFNLIYKLEEAKA